MTRARYPARARRAARQRAEHRTSHLVLAFLLASCGAVLGAGAWACRLNPEGAEPATYFAGMALLIWGAVAGLTMGAVCAWCARP